MACQVNAKAEPVPARACDKTSETRDIHKFNPNTNIILHFKILIPYYFPRIITTRQ